MNRINYETVIPKPRSADETDDAADRIRQVMERWQKVGPGEWDIKFRDLPKGEPKP